jgi:hypothetical protein
VVPPLVVLAIDENVINELVGFAFLRDRTPESFSHFLTWMRDRVVSPEIDLGHPVPRAIVVDPMMVNTPRFKACFHDLESFSAPNTSPPTFSGRWDVLHWSITSIGE